MLGQLRTFGDDAVRDVVNAVGVRDTVEELTQRLDRLLTSKFHDGPPTESVDRSRVVGCEWAGRGPSVVSGWRRIPLLRIPSCCRRDG